MTSFDPRRPDFAPYGFTCELWQPTAMFRPDRHNEIEINLLRSGSVTYMLGGRKATIPARTLCAFWAAMPHQIVSFEPTTEYYVATLPLAWFLQCALPERLVQTLLQGELVMEGNERQGNVDLDLLARWERDLRRPREDLKRAVLLELEARLLRLGLSAPAVGGRGLRRSHRAVTSVELTKVEQIVRVVAQRCTQRLSAEDIGAAVRLHPNYAMSLFKKTFGITIVSYMTKYRVSHAQRLLATTDLKIFDVALRSGFNSVSRFNAAFLEECGCSPSEYRQQHQLTQ